MILFLDKCEFLFTKLLASLEILPEESPLIKFGLLLHNFMASKQELFTEDAP